MEARERVVRVSDEHMEYFKQVADRHDLCLTDAVAKVIRIGRNYLEADVRAKEKAKAKKEKRAARKRPTAEMATTAAEVQS